MTDLLPLTPNTGRDTPMLSIQDLQNVIKLRTAIRDNYPKDSEDYKALDAEVHRLAMQLSERKINAQ